MCVCLGAEKAAGCSCPPESSAGVPYMPPCSAYLAGSCDTTEAVARGCGQEEAQDPQEQERSCTEDPGCHCAPGNKPNQVIFSVSPKISSSLKFHISTVQNSNANFALVHQLKCNPLEYRTCLALSQCDLLIVCGQQFACSFLEMNADMLVINL